MTYSVIMTLLCNRITYFLLIGVGAALGGYFFLLDREHERISTTYQQTTCTIRAAEVTVDEEIHHTRGRGHYITRTYYPEITYTYKVDGKEYEGYEYRAFERGMAEDEALAVVERFEEGKPATCYYDPADPEDSVLTLASDRRGMYYVGAWGLFLLLGGLTGWVVIDFVLPSADRAAKAKQQRLPDDFEVDIPGLTSPARTAPPRTASH